MMINDKSIKFFDKHIEIDILEKFGIKIIGTKKSFGDIRKKEKNEILKELGIENKTLISCLQTHSDNVVNVNDDIETYFENTDGLMTKNENLALLVKYADCLPIFIYDEDSKIFGCVHSGWQGSYKGIILNAIKKISPADLNKINIVFGINISCQNYEVQENFYLKFKNKFKPEIVEPAFKQDNGKVFFDNQLFNYLLLKDFGILENKIFMNNLCTFNGDDFHSYRRDKELSGRNGGIIFKI